MSSTVRSVKKRANKSDTVINNKPRKQLSTSFRLLATCFIVHIIQTTLCDLGYLSSSFNVNAQKIDCSEGYLCDFFRRFPHLPFSKPESENLGYIRTLNYMISKDRDVVPHQYYSANSHNHQNYYRKELSEIRETPLRIPTPANFLSLKESNGRKYEPKVHTDIKKLYLIRNIVF